MTNARDWPAENGRIDVDDALRALLAAIRKRTPREAADAYVDAGGYEIGEGELATCLPAYEALSIELKGIDPELATVRARVLHVAFLLGVEQGRRLEKAGR